MWLIFVKNAVLLTTIIFHRRNNNKYLQNIHQ